MCSLTKILKWSIVVSAVFAGLFGAGTQAMFATGPVEFCIPNPQEDLAGEIEAETGKAAITNASAVCSYDVGLAVYKKFDTNIDNQELFDSHLATISPSSTVQLEVELPDCDYQIDLFYGALLESFKGGERYGERLIDVAFGAKGGFCPKEEPPAPAPPPSPEPSPPPPPPPSPSPPGGGGGGGGPSMSPPRPVGPPPTPTPPSVAQAPPPAQPAPPPTLPETAGVRPGHITLWLSLLIAFLTVFLEFASVRGVRLVGVGLVCLVLFGALAYPLAPLLFWRAEQIPAGSVQAAQGASVQPTAEKPEGNTLVIPKIGVRVSLAEGTDESALSRGAWRLPTTSTPDKGSNTALAAHRFRYTPPYEQTFYLLDKLEEGDEVRVFWQGKEYVYLVSASKVVPPSALDVLAPTESPTLTLITCNPIFSIEERFIVAAELIAVF